MCLIILALVRMIYGAPSLIFKAVTIITFVLFVYDKHQGLNKGYRVAENILFVVSLMGGWVGGVCAMLVLRHKTNKNSFIGTMAVVAFVNIMITAKMRNMF